MADFISDLAAKAGIDGTTAQKGVGAVLSTLQKYVPAEVYSKVSSAIPNAGNLLSTFQSAARSAETSAVSDLSGLAGKLIGGKGEQMTALLSQFSTAGFSLETAKRFLPPLLSYLSQKVSPDTVKQIEQAVPGISQLAGPSEAGGFLGKLSRLFK